MPELKYVGPHDAVEVRDVGATVARGESCDFPADLAKSLLEQPDNWQPVKAKKTTEKES
jgi:hypothetical protein